MRKIIGLIPFYDDKKESYWMLPGYMKMLEAENAMLCCNFSAVFLW